MRASPDAAQLLALLCKETTSPRQRCASAEVHRPSRLHCSSFGQSRWCLARASGIGRLSVWTVPSSAACIGNLLERSKRDAISGRRLRTLDVDEVRIEVRAA